MTVELKETLKICDSMFKNCDIDFDELSVSEINNNFFNNYLNVRLIELSD